VSICSLRAYTTVMTASADRLVNILSKKAKAGEPVEIWRLFGCLTMEVICSTALGCACAGCTAIVSLQRSR
jgi:hypothetical protein